MTDGASREANAVRVFAAEKRLVPLDRECVHQWSSSARTVVADRYGRPDWLP
jgi:hypothetical protein